MDTDISPEELQQLMLLDGPRPFRLIDVREEDEFHICHLEWAELIPLSRFTEEAPVRLVDKDKPVVIYCHHGMRSARAAAALRRLGYEEVYNLTGGIDAWAERIYPAMRRY
jgi:adenylyltransferase/sulfurtransferase